MDVYKKIGKKQYNVLRSIPPKVLKEYAVTVLGMAKKDETILDAGFGSGLILAPLAELNRVSKIFGIDYSNTMFASVKQEVQGKAQLIKGDILKFQGIFNVVHFKAILHCFSDPKKALDKLSDLTHENGYVVTGHEQSQIEDRIEQIFNNTIDDHELELIFEYYFSLRLNLREPFVWRPFPAGNAQNAVKYLCDNRGP